MRIIFRIRLTYDWQCDSTITLNEDPLLELSLHPRVLHLLELSKNAIVSNRVRHSLNAIKIC